MRSTTIVHAMFEKAEALASRPVLWREHGRAYHPLLWREYGEQVRRLARGLIAVGLQPGERVAVLAAHDWPVVALAVMAAGGAPAVLDDHWPEALLHAGAQRTGARLLLLEPGEAGRLEGLRRALPALRETVVLGRAGEGARGLDEVLDAGDRLDESALSERLGGLEEDSPATVAFTGGTCGEPKAILLSHGNLWWTTGRLARTLEFGDDEVVLSLLPASLAAAQTVGLHLALRHGAQIYLARPEARPVDLFREVRPTVVLAPPRTWDRLARTLEDGLALEPPGRQKVSAWARALCLEKHRLEAEQQTVPPSLQAKCRLAATLVHDPLKLGHGVNRARVLACAGGPASSLAAELFASIEAPLYEVWGQAETSGAATVRVPGLARVGTQGRPLPGVELRVGAEGRIAVRGGNVGLGRLEGGALVPLADREGWLETGDVGALEAPGFLVVEGRASERVATAGGAAVGLRRIEERLRRIRLIREAVVFTGADGRLGALLTPEPAEIARFAADRALPEQAERFVEHPAVRGWLQQEIGELNHEQAEEERVGRFELLAAPLRPGELSASGAVRREAVLRRHAARVATLFEEAPAPSRPLTA